MSEAIFRAGPAQRRRTALRYPPRVDELSRLEEAVLDLAQRGRAAFLSEPTSAHLASRVGNARGFTQPAPWLAAGALNTDNFLIRGASVAGDGALVLGIAHGNYKDERCSARFCGHDLRVAPASSKNPCSAKPTSRPRFVVQ